MMGITQHQLDMAYPKSGALVAPDRMSWARSHLKIAGMLESGGKGIWILTDLGREAADMTPAEVKSEMKKLSANHHAMVVARRNAARITGEAEDGGVSSEDETDWSEQLLAKLKALSPAAFERLSQDLLRESGFVRVEVTGKSGDGRIDGTGVWRVILPHSKSN